MAITTPSVRFPDADTTSDYRFRCFDLMSGTELGQLELYTANFSRKLKDLGTFRGTMQRDQPLPFFPRPLTTRLIIDRNKVPVWDGVVTNFDFQISPTQTSQLTREIDAEEMPWLLKSRLITEDRSYSGTDMHAIATDLLNYTQAKPGGYLGIDTVSYYRPCGVLINQAYKGTDHKTIWDALLTLSNLSPGFDFSFETVYTGLTQKPVIYFRPSYPRAGLSQADTGFVLEYPGNAEGYRYPYEGTDVVNYYIGTASGASGTQLQSVSANSNLIAPTTNPTAGGFYPLLEATKSYTDVADQTQLDSLTQADRIAKDENLITPEIFQRPGSWPQLGELHVGDDVRFRATSSVHQQGTNPAVATGSGPGLDIYVRIIQIDVTLPTQGQPEMIHYTCGTVPSGLAAPREQHPDPTIHLRQHTSFDPSTG